MGEALKINTGYMPPDSDSYGVLVGWTHAEFNGKLDLRLQSANALLHSKPHDIHAHHLMLTHNQALLLGNYLLNVSGQKPPQRRKKSWLKRLLRR